jgi:DNA-binding MarR family transcriptional regulator
MVMYTTNQNELEDKAAKMKRPARPLRQTEYNALAEFRYQIRRFLRHMEDEVRAEGLNPQQYQVLLAIKGLPEDRTATVGVIAERMQVNHNSMVELLDRCEQRNLLRRSRSRSDRRQVVLEITPEGDEFLCKLARAARKELSSVGKILVQSIEELIRQKSEVDNPE